MKRKKAYLFLPLFAVFAIFAGSMLYADVDVPTVSKPAAPAAGIDREALKAELKRELRAELIGEIKKELRDEARADAQRAAEEATAGLKEELRDEARADAQRAAEEATAGIKDDIASQVSRWMEESPLLSPFKGVTLGGFVDVNYFYNFALHGDEAARQNALSPLNFIGENENNSLTFESFTLFLDKEVTDESPIGWQMHTYWGEKAKRITFLGEATTNDLDRDDIFTVSAANVSWKAPIGKGVTFTMGKIYTWIGLELVENINNPNYQHGILYNNAIPFTHTGISASYDITDTLKLSLFGVNGWDSFIDNNESKSAGWYLAWQPNDKFFISLGGIHGAEGWDNDLGAVPGDVGRRDSNGGLTQMFDVVATWQTPHDPLTLMFNFDWGTAEDGALRDIDRDGAVLSGGPDIATGGTGHWWGVAGYALYDFTDRFQGVVRYEYFDDTDGVRFFDQSIWEVTVTGNIKVRENLLIRPEYRHNDYSRAISTGFSDGDATGKRNDQEDIFGIGIEYIF